MSAAPLQAAIEVLASRDLVPLISARCTALTEAYLKAVIDPRGDKGLFRRRRLSGYGEGTVRLALSHAKRPGGCRRQPPLRLQVVRVVKDKDGDLIVDTSLTPAKPVGDFLMPPAEVGTASGCLLVGKAGVNERDGCLCHAGLSWIEVCQVCVGRRWEGGHDHVFLAKCAG